MRKIRLISKFITPQYGEQRIKIHILINISRSKETLVRENNIAREIFSSKIMEKMRQGD